MYGAQLRSSTPVPSYAPRNRTTAASTSVNSSKSSTTIGSPPFSWVFSSSKCRIECAQSTASGLYYASAVKFNNLYTIDQKAYPDNDRQPFWVTQISDRLLGRLKAALDISLTRQDSRRAVGPTAPGLPRTPAEPPVSPPDDPGTDAPPKRRAPTPLHRGGRWIADQAIGPFGSSQSGRTAMIRIVHLW